MAGAIGASSQSFLREYKTLQYLDNHDLGIGELLDNAEWFVQNKKKELLKKNLKNLGITRRIAINATNLQNYSYEENNEILEELNQYLDDFGLTGILEWHTGDATNKNSYHIHYWTNNDSQDVYNLIKHFLVDRGLNNEDSIDIEKDWDKISFMNKDPEAPVMKYTDSDKEKKEKRDQFKKEKKEWFKEKDQAWREDQKIQKKDISQMMPKTAQERENNEKVSALNDLMDQVLARSKSIKSKIEEHKKQKSEEFEIMDIPDIDKRIDSIKERLDQIKKNRGR